MGIAWEEQLATEIETADEQHKELFGRINTFLDACDNHRGTTELIAKKTGTSAGRALMERPDMNFAAILSRNHWVFDLDGTLTLPVHDFAAIRAALGIPDDVDILTHLASLSEAEATPLHSRLNDIENELADRTSPAPGVLPLIAHLARRGACLGVLTRNTCANAMRTLGKIGLTPYFSIEAIIGRDEARPKPDPDGLRILSERWSVPADSLVIVGDYLYDLMTGRAVGAATIHVDRDRNFRWPELTDIAVASLEELTARFNSSFSSNRRQLQL